MLAVPVAARDSAAMIAPEVDEFVSAETPAGFYAVGQFYERFGQTEDAEVRELLRDTPRVYPTRSG